MPWRLYNGAIDLGAAVKTLRVRIHFMELKGLPFFASVCAASQFFIKFFFFFFFFTSFNLVENVKP